MDEEGKHNLKQLQKIWYQKLKDSGFSDIEDTTSPREYLKTWHSSYFHVRYTPEAFEMKQEYYRRASHFLHEYSFASDTEKEIWHLHSDGYSLRHIAGYLQSKKIKINKDGVHKIVTRLLKMMKEFVPEEAQSEQLQSL